MSEELPKNGDVPKSSFLHWQPWCLSAGTFLNIDLWFLRRVPSAFGLCPSAPVARAFLAIGPIIARSKKKMQREGVFREMKLRGHYEKPSERRVREKAEAIRRARKLARKKLQREGLLPMKPRVIPGPPEGAAPRAFLASDPGTAVQQAKSLRRYLAQGVTPKPGLAPVARPFPEPQGDRSSFLNGLRRGPC